MNSYKNRILLLMIFALCSFNKSTQASQYSKAIGKSLIGAIKNQSAYPEDDIYNHNIMNGSYFDNRKEFETKVEKIKFIQHYFKQIQVTTDINDELIEELACNAYSRQELYWLLRVAEQSAIDQGSNIVTLAHIERGMRYEGFIKYPSEKFIDPFAIETAYHEAGHAVKAATEDIRLRTQFVSIQPIDKIFGELHWFGCITRQTEQQQQNYIDMCLAGGIAEQIFEFPEKRKFHNYQEALHDFLKRGTHADWLHVQQISNKLALTQAQNNRSACLWSSSKDLTDADNFFETYATCTDIHLNKQTIDANKNMIIRERYLATQKSLIILQPIISAIAEELLVKKVISGKRIKEIIKEMNSSK